MYNMLRILLVANLAGLIVWPGLVMAAEQEKSLRDPTRPLSYRVAAKEQTKLTLQAIFTGKDRKEAIVNGHAVSEGDSIGSATVVRIEDKQVGYILDGQSHILRLRPNVTTASGSQ